MNLPIDIQFIKIEDMPAICEKCGSEMQLGSHTYMGIKSDFPTVHFELYKCDICGNLFALQYDLFDDEGHLKGSVFCEDPNDAQYSWISAWSKEQLQLIFEHLNTCSECQNRRDNEMLSDAKVAAMIHSFSKKRKNEDNENGGSNGSV